MRILTYNNPKSLLVVWDTKLCDRSHFQNTTNSQADLSPFAPFNIYRKNVHRNMWDKTKM